MADLATEENVRLAALSPRPNQQNITLAASTGQYSDAVIRVGDEYQVSSEVMWPYCRLRALTVLCLPCAAAGDRRLRFLMSSLHLLGVKVSHQPNQSPPCQTVPIGASHTVVLVVARAARERGCPA